jgi:hypothetical protein
LPIEGTRAGIENQAAVLLEAAGDGGVIIGTHSIDYDIQVANYNIYNMFDNHRELKMECGKSC